MNKKHSFPKEKIKIVLLEKIHNEAAKTFEAAGFHVDLVPNALDAGDLESLLSTAHVVGVRSRTKILFEHLKKAKRLLAIGCFTVGTDQVALSSARSIGVPVFNAPHSSTRSVAELTIANIISLARRTGDLNLGMHHSKWQKSATCSYEVRNKTVGIIGYGHIGQQVGLLAEAIGMNVYFFDTVKKLPLGRAQALPSMDALLGQCDFVSLHVPGGRENEGLIGQEQLSRMRPGAYLLNLSRGKVVDLNAARDYLDKGHLAGAAFDVYPSEPATADSDFTSVLSEARNVILTPHIGGSTEEAQRNIGREVAASLINFIDEGSTDGAVNFPQIRLPLSDTTNRILYIHRNEPGALSEVNAIVSELGVNIERQYLGTEADIGYLIMDTDKELSDELKMRISSLSKALRTRILY